MIRVFDLDKAITFFVDQLGLVETRRKEVEKGRPGTPESGEMEAMAARKRSGMAVRIRRNRGGGGSKEVENCRPGTPD